MSTAPNLTAPVASSERDQAILDYLPLVRSLAQRYANRLGEPLEDLVQVGIIGLIKAVDRFDPARGSDLTSFAIPTILGEIRRHFRDRSWMIHVPRGLQEDHLRVRRTVDDLTAQLGRSPTTREIADSADLTDDRVLDAIAVGVAHQPMSLSGPAQGLDDDQPDIPVSDTGFAVAEGRAVMRGQLRRLPDREQRILILRFHEGLTQAEIARREGISQMHVSRLIARALDTLRERVGSV